jgi:two-component system, cell cycle sensor histidine kinase and response regulator CckA
MSSAQTKVLIVEDEAIVACDIERRLIKAGYAVPAIAASGDEALRCIEQTSPNLVLMDIHLQGPADGIAIAAEVRDRFHLPVVFLTAYADKSTLERAKGSGAFSYLIKPIGHVNLATTIEVALYRHQVEQELEKREAWLQTVLDSIADAIVVTDAAGGIQFLNPTAERLTGWTNREAIGRQFWEVAHLAAEDREIAEDLQAAIGAGIPLDLPRESRLICRGGRVAMVEGNIAISRVRNRHSGTVVVLRDITARNWEEAQLRQDQKMQAAGQLANGLALDFKRLLTVVLQYSRQLILEMAQDHAFRERLRAVHRAGNRAALLASQVVGLYRKEPVQARIVDLNLLLSQFLPILKRMAGPSIALEAALDPELGQIRADIGQLKQIVLNLVLNARDAMPLGGSVRIATGNVELPARTTYYPGSESFIRLAIEPDGANKTGEIAKPMLDPFYAGNKPGMGLGLAVVEAMVNAADGLICADGQPGERSLFEIFLPRWREPEKPPHVNSPPLAPGPRRQKRIRKRTDGTS